MNNRNRPFSGISGSRFPETRLMPWLLTGITFLVIAVAGARYLQRVFCKVTDFDTPADRVLLIPTNSDFQRVIDSLKRKKILKNQEAFIWLANRKGYPAHIFPAGIALKMACGILNWFRCCAPESRSHSGSQFRTIVLSEKWPGNWEDGWNQTLYNGCKLSVIHLLRVNSGLIWPTFFQSSYLIRMSFTGT